MFSSEDCEKVKHCVKSENGYIMLILDDSLFVNINLIPTIASKDSSVRFDYRLINKEER